MSEHRKNVLHISNEYYSAVNKKQNNETYRYMDRIKKKSCNEHGYSGLEINMPNILLYM